MKIEFADHGASLFNVSLSLKFNLFFQGCGDFKILKKSLENYDLCYSLSGMVVQEYGYHQMAGARDMGFMKQN
jgi:hypothetical protein